MCGGNKNTTTTTTAPSSAVVGNLNQAAQQVSAASKLPYALVTQGTAPVNAQQYAGANTLNAATGLLGSAAQPLTADQIQQYYNPYQQNVITATEAQFANQNAQQQQGVIGNAVSQGAWGGDRSAVAQALTAQQQQLAQAPVIAGLEQQGYTQALGTAAQQYQQNPEAVAAAEGNLGLAQYGVGTQEQQTSQAALNATYAQQLAEAGYPFQAAAFNAGNTASLAGAFGGTSQTTLPAPSLVSSLAGLGTAGIGAGMLLSDKRVKEDIREIGKTKDGQTIYRFRYKGHPQWQIGLMAQDVEKKNPDAVHEIAGIKAIDIKKATDAAARAMGGRIQGLQIGGVPYNANAGLYAGPENYVPTPMHGSAGIGLPRPSQQPQQDSSAQMFQNALKMAGGSSSGTGLLTNTSVGDTANDTLQDFRMDTLGMAEATGGRVPRAYGGLAIPSSNRINVPTRSGFGMPSFMSRGGLADGGTPDDDVVVSPDVTMAPPVVSDAAPAGVQVAQAAPSGVATNASQGITAALAAPATRQPAWKTTANEWANAGMSANGIAGVLANVKDESNFDPTQRHPDQPHWGGEAHYAHGLYQEGGQEWNNYANWLKNTHPGANWQDPQLQSEFTAQNLKTNYPQVWDRMANAKTKEEAAQAFVSGYLKPAAHLENARRSQYAQGVPAVEDYENGTALAWDGTPAPQRGVGTTSSDTGGIPSVTPIKAPDISGKTGANRTDIALSLMAAGLGMMGSRSPYAGVGIGQGGLQGVGAYEALHKQRVGEAEHQATLEQQAAIANQHPQIQERLFAQQKVQQERLFAQQKEMEAKRAEDARALEAMKESKTVQTIWDEAAGKTRNVITRGDGTREDILTHEILGTPRGQTPVPTQTPQNPAQPMPSNPRNASVVAPIQLASADPGFRVRNTQFVESGQSFNYALPDTPHMEKGMLVPEPQPISGNSVDSLKTDAATYLQTGKLPQVSRGNSPVAMGQQAYQRAVKNYANAKAASLGMTHEQIAETMRQGGMMPRFIMGQAGMQTVSIGTAMRHLDTLEQYAKAWNAGDEQTLNKLRAGISREFGSDAGTNLETVAHIVGPEIIKAIGVAGAGGERDREGAINQFTTAKSLDQVQGAVGVTKHLLQGQLEGKRKQASVSGVSEDTFKKLIGEKEYDQLANIDKEAAGKGGEGSKTIVRQGVVNSGSNKGKRIIEYSDGSREYQ